MLAEVWRRLAPSAELCCGARHWQGRTFPGLSLSGREHSARAGPWGGLLPWCLPWWTCPNPRCAVPPAETVRDIEHQFHVRLEQERGQWAQYRESAEREIAELRRRLSEGQEEENLENEMKKV